MKRLVELAAGSERKERSRIIKFLSGAIRYLEVPCSKMGKIGRLISFVGSMSFLFVLLSLKLQLTHYFLGRNTLKRNC